MSTRRIIEMEESFKIVSRIWTSRKFSWDSELIKIIPPEGSDGFSIVPKARPEAAPAAVHGVHSQGHVAARGRVGRRRARCSATAAPRR